MANRYGAPECERVDDWGSGSGVRRGWRSHPAQNEMGHNTKATMQPIAAIKQSIVA
jgi:hypothetical protein